MATIPVMVGAMLAHEAKNAMPAVGGAAGKMVGGLFGKKAGRVGAGVGRALGKTLRKLVPFARGGFVKVRHPPTGYARGGKVKARRRRARK